MNANIRTPAEVIGLVLEEQAVPDFPTVAEGCAKRLAVALKSVSKPGAEWIIRCVDGVLEWGTVRTDVPKQL